LFAERFGNQFAYAAVLALAGALQDDAAVVLA
jgi:hypothetical protein